jgi:hypothetical protein
MQTPNTTRRQLLTAIGMVGGTAALYQAMTTMGHAAETQYKGPPDLSGAWCWAFASSDPLARMSRRQG